MQTARLCSRQTCKREATVTLTYSYADSTAVIGPLSEHREPHAYDLCDLHAEQLTAPQGWRAVRALIAAHRCHAAWGLSYRSYYEPSAAVQQKVLSM